VADVFGGWRSTKSLKRWFTDSAEKNVSSVLDVDEDSDLLRDALMATMTRLLEKDKPQRLSVTEVSLCGRL